MDAYTRNQRRPNFDRGYEAMATLADLSLTEREAWQKARRLMRGVKPINEAFVLVMGVRFRTLKSEALFEREQLARWADDGGAA
jgi:hypothetical protein